MSIQTQVCRNCRTDLPLDKFHKRARSRLGVRKICAACRSATREGRRPVPAMDERLASVSRVDLMRFAQQIKLEGEEDCWIWQGSKQGRYPSFWLQGRIRAHRFALAVLGGGFNLDAEVHHACGRSLCVRPDHLVPMGRDAHIALHSELRRMRRTRRP